MTTGKPPRPHAAGISHLELHPHHSGRSLLLPSLESQVSSSKWPLLKRGAETSARRHGAPAAANCDPRARSDDAGRHFRGNDPENDARRPENPANGSSSSPHTPVLVRVKRINGQASRLISVGKLHTSRHVHTRPIDLVIFQEPSEVLRPGEISSCGGFHA